VTINPLSFSATLQGTPTGPNYAERQQIGAEISHEEMMREGKHPPLE